MARPRAFQLDDAEAALLEVFWTKGYEGSAVRDLCDATGLRPASLYAAFGDKDRMYKAAMRRYLVWIDRQLTPPEDGADGVRHILETTCALTIEDRTRRGCPIVNSVAERENLSASAFANTRENFTGLRALFRRQLQACSPARAVDDLEDMVSLLVAASVSIRLLGRAGAPSDELRGTARGALKAFHRWAE